MAPEGPKAAGAEPSGQMRDEKLHSIVARNAFASEKAKSSSPSEHFMKMRCRKVQVMARSTFPTKHTNLGPHWDLEMSKKCTLLLREEHVQSKCTKHTMFGPLFEIEMAKKCTMLWRGAHLNSKCKIETCSDHFWTFRCRSLGGAEDSAHCHNKQNMRVLYQFQLEPTLHSTTLQTQL